MTIDFDTLFNPVGVAIYGASSNPAKLGGRPVQFLKDQQYADGIYPINPNYDELQGLPCYHSVASVGKRIDVVLVLVSAEQILDALKDCVTGNVKFAVILSSGLAETGAEGKTLQNKILAYAQENNLRLLGPNCLGLMNFKKKIPLTFSSALQNKDLTASNVAFASQSGAFGSHLFGMARSMGFGYNYWITTGNEADIQLNDCLYYLAGQEDVKSIASYMEDARDGRKLVAALDKCQETDTPIVILKVGKSEAGSKAASSHTGALTGNAAVYKAVFAQKNVVQVDSVYDLLDFSNFLAIDKTVGDGRVAIVTVSGGAGVLHVDKCEELGLKVAELSSETKRKIKEVIPAFGSAANPVDITAQTASRSGTPLIAPLTYCIEDEHVDILIFYVGLLYKDGERVARQVIDVAKKTRKMVMVSWVGAKQEHLALLRQNGVPAFEEPGRGIRSLAALYHYRKGQEAYRAHQSNRLYRLPKLDNAKILDIRRWLTERREIGTALSEAESRQVLMAFDIPVVEGALAASVEEAVEIAGHIGYPVVMKIDSAMILHKSDVGGVRLNITDDDAVRRAYYSILETVRGKLGTDVPINGILIEKMEKAEAEILIGCKQDPLFGPTVAFGLGGIFVEALKEISIRVAPLTLDDANMMMAELRGAKILDGLRGKPACDKKALRNVLLGTSRMVIELKDLISEIDINPMFVFEEGKGARAGDALILLKKPSS